MGNDFSEHNDSMTSYCIKQWPCDIAEYLALINKHIKNFSKENTLARNSINSKQNESKVFINKRRIIIPTHNIHWKDLILSHLLKQYSQERIWVRELYRLIKAENFYDEKHWLSYFFWEEFEMRTKPSCLIKQVKRMNYPQSDYFTYKVEQHSLKKDITSEFKVIQEKIYAYIRIIKRHISTRGHPFNFVMTNFAGIFGKYMISHIITLSALRKTNIDEFTKQSVAICEDITDQLISFIDILEEALSIMYSKTYNSYFFIDEKDELINLVSGCLFDEKSLYKYMTTLIRMSLYSKIKELNNLFESDKQFITPDFVGVQNELCLNQLSLQYYKEKLNGKNNLSIDQFPQPYQKTIDLLKSIVQYKKPYDKLLLIYKMSFTISDCVNEFWNKVDSSLETQRFSVDSDNLMNIFDFIFIKSQMGDLLTQMKFVKSFTSTSTRSTMIGYYFSTLEISINRSIETKFNTSSPSLLVDC